MFCGKFTDQNLSLLIFVSVVSARQYWTSASLGDDNVDVSSLGKMQEQKIKYLEKKYLESK